MKRLRCICILLFLFSLAYAQQAKYVFYFIGDGMGVNQVNGTEMYLAEQEGRIGVKPLLFTAFPITGFATTFSASNSVTDSSAAGTALATGKKTYNGAISMDNERNVSLKDIPFIIHIMELLVWIMKGMSFKLLLNKRKGPVGKWA